MTPHHTFDMLRGALVHYGYWAVAAALLLENAGLPLPGETVLLLASFLAYSEKDLHLSGIILVGTIASTVGNALGYAVGNYGGRPLLDRLRHIFRISEGVLERGERLFERHGAETILVSRFIFGMRTLAGPIAGVLHMPWKKFAIFNVLGAVVWVAAISVLGYKFGSSWRLLMHYMKRLDLVLGVAFAVILLILWWRSHRARIS